MKTAYQLLLTFSLLLAAPGTSFATTILVMGDSLSAAYGIAQQSGWVNLLQQQLPQQRVINASISGETTAGGAARLPTLLQQHQPDIVVIELGANDGLRGLPIKEMQQNTL